MSENVVKKEYDKSMFFHGVCFDKKSDQIFYNSEFMTLSDAVNMGHFGKGLFGKYSRYCVCGRFNYVDNVLMLGLSMLEAPHPYVKKKARDVAIDNLLNRTEFSLQLNFEFLKAWLMYETGNELKTFTELNCVLKKFRRGSLITVFKEKRSGRIIDEINKINR